MAERIIKIGVTLYGKDVYANRRHVARLVEVHHPQTDEWETWVYTTDGGHTAVAGRADDVAAILNG